MDAKDFFEAINNYEKTSEQVLCLLRDLVKDINSFHDLNNGIKTAGTAVSVGGGLLTIGAIVLAPFTGGTSIVAATGIGASLGLGGALTNIGADVVDLIKTKKYQKTIQDLFEKRQTVCKNLSKFMNKFQAQIDEEFKKTNNEEEAFKNVLEKFKANSGSYTKTLNSAKNSLNPLRAARNSSSFALRSGGQVWKGMRLMSQNMKSAFSKLGLNIGKRTAFNVVKGATVVLSATFIVWDIISLNDSLNSKHQAADVAKEQIEKIEKELENMREIRNTLEDVLDCDN